MKHALGCAAGSRYVILVAISGPWPLSLGLFCFVLSGCPGLFAVPSLSDLSVLWSVPCELKPPKPRAQSSPSSFQSCMSGILSTNRKMIDTLFSPRVFFFHCHPAVAFLHRLSIIFKTVMTNLQHTSDGLCSFKTKDANVSVVF